MGFQVLPKDHGKDFYIVQNKLQFPFITICISHTPSPQSHLKKLFPLGQRLLSQAIFFKEVIEKIHQSRSLLLATTEFYYPCRKKVRKLPSPWRY